MSQFLFYYQRPEPATWVYMSSFVIVALYFMFHRLWSVRNLDILLIILLTPGLMMVYEGRKANAVASASVATEKAKPKVALEGSSAETARENQNATTNIEEAPTSDNQAVQPTSPLSSTTAPPLPSKPPESKPSAMEAEPVTSRGDRLQYWGFAWLLAVCGLWLIRLLLDTTMVRRPLLEPNLSSGGMTFIGLSLFIFLMANVLSSPPVYQSKPGIKPGPGYDLLKILPDIQTSPDPESSATNKTLATASAEVSKPDGRANVVVPTTKDNRALGVSRVFLILSNLVLILGIVAVGYWHFENLKTGIGVATLFLLLPYTAQMTGRIDHLVPGALLVLAIAMYRQPILSGIMLGGAAGLVFYPFFLFPLWISFYWQRGRYRFLYGFIAAVVSMVVALALVTPTTEGLPSGFFARLGHMFGIVQFALDNLDGIWGLGWHPYFRIPVMVAFILLSLSFVFWPAQKSLSTLMSCSAAIMTAAQFCYAYGGGLYMAWFLPCALLTVFRPNLDDCIALDVVRSFNRKKPPVKAADGAAASNYAAAG